MGVRHADRNHPRRSSHHDALTGIARHWLTGHYRSQSLLVYLVLPMAIEPGQNTPLGRAVIGGLIFATCATLFLVPAIFGLMHGRQPDNANQAADVLPLLSH